jgi:hypothetical protein
VTTATVYTHRADRRGGFVRFLARFWPWVGAACLLWLAGRWVIGTLFSDFMLQYAALSPLLILLLALTVVAAFAHEVQATPRETLSGARNPLGGMAR